MAVTVTGTTTAAKTTGAASSLTFAHTATGDPIYLAVALAGATSAVHAVTYNGVGAAKLFNLTTGAWAHDWWVVYAPAAGAANFVITASATVAFAAVARNINGADLDGLYRNAVIAGGTSTAPSVTVTSVAGDLVLDLVSSDGNSQVFTVGAGQTSDAAQSSVAGTDVKTAASREAGAASVAMTWTLSVSDAWAASGISVPVAGTVGTLAARVSQDAVELLSAPPAPASRVSQDAIEVLSGAPIPARVSQDVIEVLSGDPLPTGWKLLVDGVNQTAHVVSCSIVWTLNERTRATVVFNDLVPDRLAEIVAYDRDGVDPIFGGVILERHAEGWTQAQPDLRVTCECVDFLAYADWVTVSASYAAGTLKTVLTALVDDYLSDYGITLNAAHVDGPDLSAVTWNLKRVSDALRELSDQSGYFISMSPEKVLTLAPPGDEAAPFDWTDTPPTHVQEADWRDLATVPANKVVLTCGPNGLATIADEHHWGDGATRIFPLNSPYVAIVGALRTGSDSGGLDPGGFPVGTYGVDDMPWTYDADLNAMRQRTDQPLLETDEFIMLWYSAQFPFTVEATTAATPVIEYHEARPELLTIAAAQQIADELLANLSGDPLTIHGRFNEDGYEVGQLLTVDLAGMRQVAGTFTIRTITLDLVLLDYWQYSLEATEGTIAAPSHLVGWRQIIGQGYAIPGPWDSPPAVVLASAEGQEIPGPWATPGLGSETSTIISAGVAAALGGPVWLGGTRETGVRTNPAAWAPVINFVEYVAGVTFVGMVRADLWTEHEGVTARARLWNLTEARAVGISEIVNSQTAVHVLFPVAIAFGHRYRLEVLASQQNAVVRCLGVLEAK